METLYSLHAKSNGPERLRFEEREHGQCCRGIYCAFQTPPPAPCNTHNIFPSVHNTKKWDFKTYPFLSNFIFPFNLFIFIHLQLHFDGEKQTHGQITNR